MEARGSRRARGPGRRAAAWLAACPRLWIIQASVLAAAVIASGVMVIAARNPVHSVLFLILAFFNAAGLFVLMGAEFLAMILVVVYVGAVAVLFLFVVMMLDINFVELRRGAIRYLPVGALIGGILFVELCFVATLRSPGRRRRRGGGAGRRGGAAEQHAALGEILYTRYFYAFQAAGMVLLVAMIGAIVLTLRHAGRQAPACARRSRARPRTPGRNRQGPPPREGV